MGDAPDANKESRSLESKRHIALCDQYCAHNYSPLDIVISSANGVWVNDVDGHRYLDMLSAYSALNFGHNNPQIVAAAHRQLDRLTMTSRAFLNDQIGPLSAELCQLFGFDQVILMNSGAEAVETALKVARRWGYRIKGVPEDRAEIICFDNNFAGRTITIIGFSTNPSAKKDFGPFTAGFKTVPFGDIEAVKAAITPNTVGILFEPIQGEGGVIIPPDGFIRQLRQITAENRVLLVADEIQTGLYRTGKLLCCDHEDVKPDLVLLAKSLGGGVVPISAVLANNEVMNMFDPGSHGSTFGGNPFACAIAREVLKLISDNDLESRITDLGSFMTSELQALKTPYISAIRSRGLMIGADIKPEHGAAKKFCKLLKENGVLCKDTRDQTIRFAPPLIINKKELEWGLARIAEIFSL